MKKYYWLFIGLFISISGCIPSLYPLYTDDTLAFEETLLGTWRETFETMGEKSYRQWQFKRQDEKSLSYTLAHTNEKGKSSQYQVHLVRLGNNYYFDFYPEGDLQDLDEFLQLHLFPVHTFARVEITREKVVFHMFDTEWLEKLIEQRKIRIRHEEIDGMLLLSAGTQELQEFITKYGDDPKAYVDPVVLLRHEE